MGNNQIFTHSNFIWNECKNGTKKIGNDGNMWIVEYINNTKRWKLHKKQSKKLSIELTQLIELLPMKGYLYFSAKVMLLKNSKENVPFMMKAYSVRQVVKDVKIYDHIMRKIKRFNEPLANIKYALKTWKNNVLLTIGTPKVSWKDEQISILIPIELKKIKNEEKFMEMVNFLLDGLTDGAVDGYLSAYSAIFETDKYSFEIVYELAKVSIMNNVSQIIFEVKNDKYWEKKLKKN